MKGQAWKDSSFSLHLALHLQNPLQFLQKLISFSAAHLLLVLMMPYYFFLLSLGLFSFYYLKRKTKGFFWNATFYSEILTTLEI